MAAVALISASVNDSAATLNVTAALGINETAAPIMCVVDVVLISPLVIPFNTLAGLMLL